MARFHFRIVNVFAEAALHGNPLCVFEDARGMDAATMQALARQFNLSETTFILPSEVADAKVRVFTTGYEMRFAGHPTLGSAHVLRACLSKSDALRLEFLAGVVDVSAQGDHWTLIAPTTGMPITRLSGRSDAVIARMLGLEASDLAGTPMWVDTGADQLLIPIKTADAVHRASPSSQHLEDWPLSSLNHKSAYLFAIGELENDIRQAHVRYFLTMQGNAIVEDPGTGSACANLGGWLIATGAALPAQIRVIQGDALGRPCRLSLEVTSDLAVRVGGRVIEIGRGSIEL